MNFCLCFSNIKNITQCKKTLARDNANRTKKMLEKLDLHKIPYLILLDSLINIEMDDRTDSPLYYEDYEISLDHIVFTSNISKNINDPSKKSLIVGKDNNESTKIAKFFGFTNYITFQDYLSERPYLCPSYKYEKRDGITVIEDYKDDKMRIDQIIVYSFNYDWLCLYQVLIDILRSDGIPEPDHESIEQRIICYILNNNITKESEYEIPRFTNGAFVLGLKNVYRVCTGRDIDVISFDQPKLGLYELCEERLKNVDKIYMIDDKYDL